MAIRTKSQKVVGLIPSSIPYPNDVVQLERQHVTTDRIGAFVACFEQDELTPCIRDIGALAYFSGSLRA